MNMKFSVNIINGLALATMNPIKIRES